LISIFNYCSSLSSYSSPFIFFFQAEDGIRCFHVTGVQTCALPISRTARHLPRLLAELIGLGAGDPGDKSLLDQRIEDAQRGRLEIGRASCREMELNLLIFRIVI